MIWPKGSIVIRLYALRQGLRRMIDEGLVGLEQAIDIFTELQQQIPTLLGVPESAYRTTA